MTEENKISLTDDQDKTFGKVQEFLVDEENPAIVIIGSAGTGKTTLMKYIVDYLMDKGRRSVCAVAPTHKARRVLEKTLNTDRFLPIPGFTVASVLGKCVLIRTLVRTSIPMGPNRKWTVLTVSSLTRCLW